MQKHSCIRRGAALALCAALLSGCVPAYAVDDGVCPVYDEAYYATTDYYGNLTQGSVVKSYTTNGAASLTDYGEYDELVNLTDGLVPSTANGKSVFTFDGDSIPAHFYFEGKTEKPFAQLPWTLSVHYALNGVATRAEDLAGKTGVVEITVDAVPNEAAPEYARNNYTLEAMAIFNQDDILSLEAPGAQVQLVGNLRAVLFIGLPGEECHFTIRVGSEDFSFGGMTLLMVPATLSQLEEIAKLSTRKDDLEESYDKLSSSLDALLNSMNGISSSLYATANGLDQLDVARDTISQGKAAVYEKAGLARSELDALNETLAALPGHLDAAGQLAEDTHQSLGKVNSTLRTVQQRLVDLQEEVDEVLDDLDELRWAGSATAADLTSLGRRVDRLKQSLTGLMDDIAALKLQVGGQDITVQGMTAGELSACLTQARSIQQVYRSVGGGAPLDLEKFILGAMLLQGSTLAEAQSTRTSYLETSGQIEAVRQQLNEASLAAGGPEVSLAEAEAYFFGTLVPGEYEAAGLPADQAAAQAAADKAAYQTGKSKMQALEQEFQAFSTSGSMSQEQFFAAAIHLSGGGSTTEAATQAKQLLELYQGYNSLIQNGQELCSLLGSNGLAGHTATLLTETTSAIAALDSATTEVGNLLQSLEKALDATDELYAILDENLPELQQTLTDSKTTLLALSSTITGTSDFLGALESLLQTSGQQLDEGTKQTLEGLAASLRATARSLNTTGEVKAAKNSIGSLIEDTWREYTGEINNLLLMNAEASAISLTDERNPSPQSIQVLIRTQEIKQDAAAEAAPAARQVAQTTLWQRIAQMFRDFWSAIIGIFQGKE